MNDAAIHIADDQEWRIFEGLSILQKLIVSGIEIFMLTIVLLTEKATLPDIRPTFPATVLGRALLESKPHARGVRLGRLRMSEYFTQIQNLYNK